MKKIKPTLLLIMIMISNLILAQSTEIKDPYLWLEEVESEKSLEWVKEQNEISKKRIQAEPLFSELKEKYLKVFNDKEKIAYPSMVGKYIYNFWRDENNERGVLRRTLKTDYLAKKNNWEIILDIDKLSKKEGKKWEYSGVRWLDLDQEICLITLSDGGKDENEIREFNVGTKSFVENGFKLEESKGSAIWFDKDHLLVYRNFGEGTLTTSGYARQIKLWKRGTALKDAKLIFETESKSVGAFANRFYSLGKKEALINNLKTFYESELYHFSGNKIKKINYPSDADLYGVYKGELLIYLNSDWNKNGEIFKKGYLISLNLQKILNNQFDIKTIYAPDKKSSLYSLSVAKDFIVLNTLENVQNKLIHSKLIDGKWSNQKIDTPEFGSIFLSASSNGRDNTYFFGYSNFITPTTLYYVSDNEISMIKKRKGAFETNNLEIHQYSVASKDGTIVPYFIVHKKDIELNGKNPTLMNAYGGFNSAKTPSYSTSRGIGWIEQGGVYVLANIRGGGEFGPNWHHAALKEKRQNAYDDFYAVSEDVINRKITSPKHLGAYGWSNGGLLAGVVFTQRPELYNAVIVGAPLLDMKRYSKLLAGASWIAEYGDPDIPEEWEYIKKYSPYHNLSKDKKYPEVLFVTSTKDDRVHPGHARKMGAKMKEMGHPFLYHETLEGGHGGASTNSQVSDMLSTMYTYLYLKLIKL